MKDSLEKVIIDRYEKSELKDLIDYLSNIEDELEHLGVPLSEQKVPARLKRIVKDINESRESNIYIELIDAMPYFGPFRGLAKIYVRALLSWQRQIRSKINSRDKLISGNHEVIQNDIELSKGSTAIGNGSPIENIQSDKPAPPTATAPPQPTTQNNQHQQTE